MVLFSHCVVIYSVILTHTVVIQVHLFYYAQSWEYELFSIMVHSGNATGGHYYAYIK